jgi:hypothetical protein
MRNDIHRSSEIIPANYENVLFYNLATTDDGWPIPAFGVDCRMDHAERDSKGSIIKRGEHADNGRCCLVGLRDRYRAKWAQHGGTGQCTVCGTRFVYGEIWRHRETGEHIHVGHICAEKYKLIADYGEFKLGYEAFKKARATELKRKMVEEDVELILNEVDGLREAFKVDHDIVDDIRERFERTGRISEKQIALVLKLKKQSEEPEKKLLSVPTGRVEVKGQILTSKVVDGYYGSQHKMLVEVESGEGVYRVYGTVPAALERIDGPLKGKRVSFVATLSERELGFGFFKRPSKAKLEK